MKIPGWERHYFFKKRWIKVEKNKHWDKSNWDTFKTEGNTFYKDMVRAMLNELSPDSLAVQELVNKQYLLINPIMGFNKASYIKLADCIGKTLIFGNSVKFSPKITRVLVESMLVYAQHIDYLDCYPLMRSQYEN